MKSSATNIAVGEALGLSHATVSRIRTGDRKPSLGFMLAVEKTMRWKLGVQAVHRQNATYAENFELVIDRYFSHVDEFNPPKAVNYGVG